MKSSKIKQERESKEIDQEACFTVIFGDLLVLICIYVFKNFTYCQLILAQSVTGSTGECEVWGSNLGLDMLQILM